MKRIGSLYLETQLFFKEKNLVCIHNKISSELGADPSCRCLYTDIKNFAIFTNYHCHSTEIGLVKNSSVFVSQQLHWFQDELCSLQCQEVHYIVTLAFESES